ncbi:hypothetical protein [Burkholderia sp. S-53]|nr:hypothetical protein [Burkholderia sp. S-53]UXU90545.1 hypothetical protein LXM88_35245 [Burkholderia sp. S-53]
MRDAKDWLEIDYRALSYRADSDNRGSQRVASRLGRAPRGMTLRIA